MTDMRNPNPSPQDASTLPQQPHEGCTGYAEDELKEKAREAGEVELDELHPCWGCTIYRRGDWNDDPQCDTCKTNPEPEDNVALDIAAMRRALDCIEDSYRVRWKSKKLGDDEFQAALKEAVDDINDFSERLIAILSPVDAEAIAEDHQVAEVLEGGGQ